MKTFSKQAAQGDTLYTRVKSIPKTATRVEKFDGYPRNLRHDDGRMIGQRKQITSQ